MSDVLARLCGYVSAAAAIAAATRPAVIEEKNFHDYVTDMDRRLEDMLRDALEPMFGVPVVGEETVDEDDRLPDVAIVVDPLDGTGNWIAGLPFAAVSVALVEHGVSTLAAVVSIGPGTVFSAEAGRGAWRNGAPLHLADSMPQPLIALSTGLMDAIVGGPAYGRLRAFGKLRNLGSQALQLCAVAQGALALNASREARLWDDAAGRLIAAEAGAQYRAFVPAASRTLPTAHQGSLCAHPSIADSAEAVLAPYLEI